MYHCFVLTSTSILRNWCTSLISSICCFKENLCMNVSLYLKVYFKIMTFTFYIFGNHLRIFLFCRFLVALLYGHLKLQRLLKTKNTHMVTLDLYPHATPLISIYVYIEFFLFFYFHVLLVVMLVVKYNLDLFSWKCFCNFTIVFISCFSFRTW